MFRQTMLILTLVCCASVYGAGGVYKWVDEKGTVTYHDTPPPPGSKYETLSKPPGPSQDPAAVMKALREKEEAADKARSEAQRQKETSKETQSEEAKRAENCNHAKHNLEILEKSPDPIQINDKGIRTRLNDEQRQEEIEKNHKFIQSNCEKS